MTDHPITPPPELVQQWDTEGRHQDYCTVTEHIATRAARWGSDQELDACCEWLMLNGYGTAISRLRAARRPKPPSLKEQALDLLDKAEDPSWDINDFSIVRRALEALPE
jgi:hypothetical protein